MTEGQIISVQVNVWQLAEDSHGIDAGAHVAQMPDGYWWITYGLWRGRRIAIYHYKLDPANYKLILEYPMCPLNLYIPPEGKS